MTSIIRRLRRSFSAKRDADTSVDHPSLVHPADPPAPPPDVTRPPGNEPFPTVFGDGLGPSPPQPGLALGGTSAIHLRSHIVLITFSDSANARISSPRSSAARPTRPSPPRARTSSTEGGTCRPRGLSSRTACVSTSSPLQHSGPLAPERFCVCSTER